MGEIADSDVLDAVVVRPYCLGVDRRRGCLHLEPGSANVGEEANLEHE